MPLAKFQIHRTISIIFYRIEFLWMKYKGNTISVEKYEIDDDFTLINK